MSDVCTMDGAAHPMWKPAFCPVHDRIKCRCGYRLVEGSETACPRCNRSVRLQDRLKGEPT